MDLIFFGLFLVLSIVFYFLASKFSSNLLLLAAGLLLLVTGIQVLGVLGGGNLSYLQPVNTTTSYSSDYFVWSNSTPLMTGDVIENTTINGNFTVSQGFKTVYLSANEQQLTGYVLLIIGLGTLFSGYLDFNKKKKSDEEGE